MGIEGHDSMFGQENSVATAQSSSQPQLPEPDNKLDDSIDNQQQVSNSSSYYQDLLITLIYILFIVFICKSFGIFTQHKDLRNGVLSAISLDVMSMSKGFILPFYVCL